MQYTNLGIRLQLHVVVAQVAFHSKRPDFRGEVCARLPLLGVVSHTLANVVLAAIAPDIEWHLHSGSVT